MIGEVGFNDTGRELNLTRSMRLSFFRWSVVSACLLLCNVSLAQDVVVEEFTPGTTISSASVNSNFGKLADKANDNATRLGTAESDIAAMVSASTGKQYVWLGYTTVPYDAEADYANRNNGILLSLHCKSEFGPDAFVASEVAIQNIIMTGNDFFLPQDIAWLTVLKPNAGSLFFGEGGLTSGYAAISSNGQIYPGQNPQSIWPVACVALR